jgi:hypothetical protein
LEASDDGSSFKLRPVPANQDYTTRWVVHGFMLIRGSA